MKEKKNQKLEKPPQKNRGQMKSQKDNWLARRLKWGLTLEMLEEMDKAAEEDLL